MSKLSSGKLVLPLLLCTVGLAAFTLFKVQNEIYAEVKSSEIMADTELQIQHSIKQSEVLGTIVSFDNKTALKSSYKSIDTREYVLNEYFKSRNSPLQGLAHIFVESCEKYGAPQDCIVLAAIARHETDLCNYGTSFDTYNCMGWGGPPPYRWIFSSVRDHIDTATRILVNQYGIKYMEDPRLMEDVFCGPQAECDNWGNRILYFMREIDEYGINLGVGRLTDLRDSPIRY